MAKACVGTPEQTVDSREVAAQDHPAHEPLTATVAEWKAAKVRFRVTSSLSISARPIEVFRSFEIKRAHAPHYGCVISISQLQIDPVKCPNHALNVLDRTVLRHIY